MSPTGCTLSMMWPLLMIGYMCNPPFTCSTWPVM